MSYEYMGVTDTANIMQAAIASMIQDQLVEAQRLPATVMDLSSLAVPGVKSVAVPRGSNLTAAAKSEGTEFNAQHFTYAADNLLLSSHYVVPVDVEDIAQIQSAPAIMADLTSRIGVALADAIDASIYAQLKLCSSTAPDHIVAYLDTVNKDLEIQDIVNAHKLLGIQKVPRSDRYLLIGPSQEANLLKIDTFVEAHKYGSRESLLNGEIGRVYGFSVIVSNAAESDSSAIFYHKTHCAFASQMAKFEKNRNPKNLSDILAGQVLYGAKVMGGGLRGVLVEG